MKTIFSAAWLFVLSAFFSCTVSAETVRIQVGESVLGRYEHDLVCQFNPEGLINRLTLKTAGREEAVCDIALTDLGESQYHLFGVINGLYQQIVDIRISRFGDTARFIGKIASPGQPLLGSAVDDTVTFFRDDAVLRWYGDQVALAVPDVPNPAFLSVLWGGGDHSFHTNAAGIIHFPALDMRFRYIDFKEGRLFCSQTQDTDWVSPENDGWYVKNRYSRVTGRFSCQDTVVDAINFIILDRAQLGVELLALYINDIYFPRLGQEPDVVQDPSILEDVIPRFLPALNGQ